MIRFFTNTSANRSGKGISTVSQPCASQLYMLSHLLLRDKYFFLSFQDNKTRLRDITLLPQDNTANDLQRDSNKSVSEIHGTLCHSPIFLMITNISFQGGAYSLLAQGPSAVGTTPHNELCPGSL